MSITWRYAVLEDAGTLAQWNHWLIHDSGHRNPMTVAELELRMRGFLGGDYRAIIYSSGADMIGYALYCASVDSIYLRQLFIRPERRRLGYGRAAITLLRQDIWPKDVRLTVDVLTKNEAARSFWRAMGYRDYCITLEILPESSNP